MRRPFMTRAGMINSCFFFTGLTGLYIQIFNIWQISNSIKITDGTRVHIKSSVNGNMSVPTKFTSVYKVYSGTCKKSVKSG